MTKSNKSRQAEYKARQREAGLIPLTVWIPKDKKDDFLEYVKDLEPRIEATYPHTKYTLTGTQSPSFATALNVAEGGGAYDPNQHGGGVPHGITSISGGYSTTCEAPKPYQVGDPIQLNDGIYNITDISGNTIHLQGTSND